MKLKKKGDFPLTPKAKKEGGEEKVPIRKKGGDTPS